MLVIFMVGLFGILIKSKHLISVMICLELMIFNLMILIYKTWNIFGLEPFFILMCLMVGEGCFALSLLVSYVRENNSDYFLMENLTKF